MELQRTFTNGDVCRQFTSGKNVDDNKIAIEWILGELKVEKAQVCPTKLDELFARIKSLHSKFDSKFKASSYNKQKFRAKNADWLTNEFKVDLVIESAPAPGTSRGGRPPLPFDEKSERSKKREGKRLSGELQHIETSAIVAAAGHSAYVAGKRDLASILSEAIRSPTRPSKIRKRLFGPEVRLSRYSTLEALALIMDLSLSKEQYMAIRSGAASKGSDIYPPYYKVFEAKSECRPSPKYFHVTESVARLDLQALLNHTAKRICDLQEEVITQFVEGRSQKALYATLICSWGFDGSSGQSQFKQKFDDPTKSDESLFATTMIPLRLVHDSGEVIWSNHTPQSVRYCRPIKLEYIKESAEHILKEKAAMDEEILSLKQFEIFLHRIRVLITFSLSMTLIDGKVLNIVTGTPSMQTCPICKATPSQFNELTNMDTEVFDPAPGTLKFGISPLHAWIRIMEFLLKVSYRLELKKWQAPKGSTDLRKQRIQVQLREELGVKVDRPKPGGAGSTNDGNTARSIFKNVTAFCKITGLENELVDSFHTILVALSCQLPIDPVLFGDFCKMTAVKYVSLYPWFPMPSTVHKILIHGKDIIINSLLPVGMLGEEASEGQNKVYKKFRIYHARTRNRTLNLTDIFNRVLDSSDPILSYFSLDKRIRKQKHVSLPEGVRKLLSTPTEVVVDELEDLEEDPCQEEQEDRSGLPETVLYLDELELSDTEEI